MNRRLELGGLSLDGGRRSRQRFYLLLALSNLTKDYERATVAAIVDEVGPGRADPDSPSAVREVRATIRDLQSLGWVERFGREIVLTRLGADVLSIAFTAIVEVPAQTLETIHPGWSIDEGES